MHESLKNRTYLGKKQFFNFLGADFVAPKSGHQREKQPVLGPAYNQFGIYHSFYVSLLEPCQSNLSNPGLYSEPCQMCKMAKSH